MCIRDRDEGHDVTSPQSLDWPRRSGAARGAPAVPAPMPPPDFLGRFLFVPSKGVSVGLHVTLQSPIRSRGRLPVLQIIFPCHTNQHFMQWENNMRATLRKERPGKELGEGCPCLRVGHGLDPAKPASATLAGADLLTETCGVVTVTVHQCQRDVVVLVRVHGNHECFSNACGFDE